MHTSEYDDDLAKRTRYNRTAIDWSYPEKCTKYKDLPDVYIIFITTKDTFKLGRVKYEIKQYIDDTGVEYNDGEHRLFFNTALKDGSPLSELMQYIAAGRPENKNFGALSKAVRFRKVERKEWVICAN